MDLSSMRRKLPPIRLPSKSPPFDHGSNSSPRVSEFSYAMAENHKLSQKMLSYQSSMDKKMTELSNNLRYMMGLMSPQTDTDIIEEFEIPQELLLEESALSESERVRILRKHLVSVIKKILSTGYHFYLEDSMSANQTKAYCSKHIVANLKRILETSPDSLTIMREINNIVGEITNANLKRYQQKEVSGVPQKVKESVKEINHLQSDMYDFLYLNQIEIVNREDGNYFDKIMITINKMIELPYTILRPEASSTYLDFFEKLIKNIVVCCADEGQKKFNAESKKFKEQLHREKDINTPLEQSRTKEGKENKVGLVPNIKDTSKDRNSGVQDRSKRLSLFGKLPHLITEKQKQNVAEKKKPSYVEFMRNKIMRLIQINLRQETQHTERSDEIVKEILGIDDLFQITKQEQKKLLDNYDQLLEDSKIKDKLRHLSSNAKIPQKVKTFTKEEIQNGMFEISHSTLLRIITKWSEELKKYFEHPNDEIFKKMDKFKTSNRSFIDLEEFEQQNDQNKLYSEIVKLLEESSKEIVQPLLEQIKQENYRHQEYFGNEELEGIYIEDKEANIGGFAARTQRIYGLYMVNYLNCLIGELTKIPSALTKTKTVSAKKNFYTEEKKKMLESINLVTNKMGDLLRAKYSCNERDFIRIMELLESLSENHPSVLKVIRIKNRLTRKDNDVMVNFLMLNRIQCEFQISISVTDSIQEIKGRKSNEFNHFLYEISRNILGPISELTSITCQHDQLCSDYFMKDMANLRKKVNLKGTRSKFNFNAEYDRNISQNLKLYFGYLPFVCDGCGRSKIKMNTNSSFRSVFNRFCAQCLCQRKLLGEDSKQSKSSIVSMSSIGDGDKVSKSGSSSSKKEFAKGYELLNEFLIQRIDPKTYKSLLSFSDVRDPQRYKKVHSFNNLRDMIPQAGYYLDINQKSPKVHFFMQTNYFQKVYLFRVSSQEIQEKSNNKEVWMRRRLETSSHEKFKLQNSSIEMLAVVDFRDSGKQKTWVKCFPQNLLFWEFKEKLKSKFNSEYLNKRLFSNEVSARMVDSMEIEFYQDWVRESRQVNLNYYVALLQSKIERRQMVELVSMKRKEVKISKRRMIAKEPMIREIFKVHESKLHLISAFRAKNAISDEIPSLEWASKLSNLTVLNLSFNKVLSITGVEKMVHLVELKLSNNKLKSLDGIEHLSKLELLDVSSNKIQDMTKLVNLSKLKYLDLSDTSAVTVDLDPLTDLEQISLNNCQDLVEFNSRCCTKIECLQLKEVTKVETVVIRTKSIGKLMVSSFDIKIITIECDYIKELEYLKSTQNKDLVDKKNKAKKIASQPLNKSPQSKISEEKGLTQIQENPLVEQISERASEVLQNFFMSFTKKAEQNKTEGSDNEDQKELMPLSINQCEIQSLVIDSNENELIEFFKPTEHLCLCYSDKYDKKKYLDLERDGLIPLTEGTLKYINEKLQRLTFCGFSKGLFKRFLTFRNINYELLEIMKYYQNIEQELSFQGKTVQIEKISSLGIAYFKTIKEAEWKTITKDKKELFEKMAPLKEKMQNHSQICYEDGLFTLDLAKKTLNVEGLQNGNTHQSHMQQIQRIKGLQCQLFSAISCQGTGVSDKELFSLFENDVWSNLTVLNFPSNKIESLEFLRQFNLNRQIQVLNLIDQNLDESAVNLLLITEFSEVTSLSISFAEGKNSDCWNSLLEEDFGKNFPKLESLVVGMEEQLEDREEQDSSTKEKLIKWNEQTRTPLISISVMGKEGKVTQIV